MNAELSPPQGLEQEGDEEEDLLGAGPGPSTVAATRPANQIVPNRSGSPNPPKALFRSTTGKGVAFTEDDVAFLMRFMEYRKYVWHFVTISILLTYPQVARKIRYGSILERCRRKGSYSSLSHISLIFSALCRLLTILVRHG
jgi:hypothetical protein